MVFVWHDYCFASEDLTGMHFELRNHQQLHHLHAVTGTSIHTRTTHDDPKYCLKYVKQQIGGFSSRKRAGRRVMTAPALQPSNQSGHDLASMGKKLACRNCSQLKRKTEQGQSVATTWMCRACDIPLCRDGCLVQYHTRHSV